jgi:energy-coupling factor transporter ATP-binding protein EcfA2
MFRWKKTLGLLALILIQGVISYYATLYSATKLFEATDRKTINYCLLHWFLCTAANAAMVALQNWINRDKIKKPLRRMLFRGLLKDIVNPDFILAGESGQQVGNAIKTGIMTIVQILGSAVSILGPIVQLCSRLSVVSKLIGPMDTVYIACSFSLIFICGFHLLAWNTRASKKANIDAEGCLPLAIADIENIKSDIPNGSADMTIDKIVDNYTARQDMQIPIDCLTNGGYQGLEVLQSLIVALFTYKVSPDSIHKAAAIFTCLRTASDSMWWLFNAFNNIAQALSGIGCLQELWKRLPSSFPSIPDTRYIEMIDLPKYARLASTSKFPLQVQFAGKSGSGKSTFVKRLTYELSQRAKITGRSSTAFVGQGGSVPMVGQRTWLEYFLSDLSRAEIDNLPEDGSVKDAIVDFAQRIGLSDFVTLALLNSYIKGGKQPSGGQERRLVFLRGILAVVLRVREIEVLILDEVTSGLDSENAMLVNSVVAALQRELGFLVCFIDHGEYACAEKVTVEKLTVAIVPNVEDPSPDSPDENIDASWFGKVRKMFDNLYKPPADTGPPKTPKLMPHVEIVKRETFSVTPVSAKPSTE